MRIRQHRPGSLAHLREISHARLVRQLGMVRDAVPQACHLPTIARHHPYLLVIGVCAGSAIAAWWLSAVRRQPPPCAPAPRSAAVGSWVVPMVEAASGLYRLWAQSRQ